MFDSVIEPSARATPIHLVTPACYEAWRRSQSDLVLGWLDSIAFHPAPGSNALVPGPDGRLGLVVQTLDASNPIWSLGASADGLPEGSYQLDEIALDAAHIESTTALMLGWVLGSYSFTRYKPRKRRSASLAWSARADRAEVERLAEGIFLARDLINTPAEEMGPDALANAVAVLASQHAGAVLTIIEGDDLRRNNYPLIHAVGRASTREPRLIDLVWGDPQAPKVTLVGKGVCFDSGGLDIKPSSGMRLMKKDMGGAATVLGLAHAIMAAHLPIRLRVLIPAVENAISGNAFRPGDIFRSRKGLSVEIGNTDAEGRLILADALTEASSEKPELLLDIATLTGAARTALGPDLPALFTPNEDLASGLLAAGGQSADPLWRLPLWQPYRRMIQGKMADLDNSGEGGMAGAITAALFLESFVEPGTPWAHIDSYSWNSSSRPGRPEGGEALVLRGLYSYLISRFG